MKIIIKGSKEVNTKLYKNELKRAGFKWKKSGKYTGAWEKDVAEKDIEHVSHWCEQRHLSCIIDDSEFNRSKDYRKVYFAMNKPVLHGKYQCVYCGRLLTRDKVTVDHVFPVSAVKRNGSKLNRWIMKNVYKLESVNDEKNLVSSCQNCNMKKGKKIGFYPIRAFLGKYPIFWITLYLLMIIVCIYGLWRYINFFFLR